MKKKRANRMGLTAKIAKQFNVDARTVRAWRRAGAPLDDPHKLKTWLSTRRRLIVEKPTSAAGSGNGHPTPASKEIAGTPSALRRLERMELAVFADLQSALESNDPLRIKAARDSWLKVGDSLRRYDILVEVNRRDAGEVRPVSELLSVVKMFTYALRLSLSENAQHVGELVGATPMNEIGPKIQRVFTESLFSVSAALFSTGKHSWAASAVKEELEQAIKWDDEAWACRSKLFWERLRELQKTVKS